MRPIHPHTLYESRELRDLIRGVVKIDTLRRHGLTGSPGAGYWGQNIIDSLNNYWDNLARQRDTGKVMKEDHLEYEEEHVQSLFDKRTNPSANREVHSPSGKTGLVEGQRERFQRQISQDKV